MGLQVHFIFDSARVKPKARHLLDGVARRLRDPMSFSRSVRIEGHTDSLGSVPYNHSLSLRRALAVRRYLTQQHRIAPHRLRIRGYGFERPEEIVDTTAAVNRRVELVWIMP